jgi:uncharacterized surface anchored protein
MRKIFLASTISIIFLLAGNFIYATVPANDKEIKLVSFTGVVTDNETGESLAGVLVKIEDTGKVAYTDFDGKFEIAEMVPGKYNISMSMISYQPNEMDFEINGEESDVIEIRLNQVELK